MVAVEAVGFEDSTMVSAVVLEKARAVVGGDDWCGFGSSTEKHKDDTRKCCSCEEKKKYELVDYDDLPNYLKHNEFILSYYRCNWPWKQTILSIFSIHNETINVWTHLIGFFIFLALTIGTAAIVPRDATVAPAAFGISPTMMNIPSFIQSVTTNMSVFQGISKELNASAVDSAETLPSMPTWYLPGTSSEKFSQANETEKNQLSSSKNGGDAESSGTDKSRNNGEAETTEPISRWPFMAFMLGAMFCLLTSSACHLFSCHSEHCSYVMLRLDYAGISTLIVTSFYPLVYYAFLCDPFFRDLYIGFITAFGLATVLVSLVPVFETPEFRIVRAGLFFCMGVSGLVPIVHKLFLYSDRPEAVLTTGYELAMGAFYGLGVVIYATRIPERWMPGKFDLAGHSHQLFHVLVIAGAYTHYLAGLVYLQWRDMERC